jgi:hypothetical protein
MFKPLTILGILLIVGGTIGYFYTNYFALAIIFGVTILIVGITVDVRSKPEGALEGEPATLFCPNCGSAVNRNANYCPYCRKKL